MTRIVLFILIGLYSLSAGSGILNHFLEKKSEIVCSDWDSDESDTEDSEEKDELSHSLQHHSTLGLFFANRHSVWPSYSANQLYDCFAMPELQPPDFNLFA